MKKEIKEKRVADQLVDTLHEAGIRRIYAVTGDSLNTVNDAVRRHRNLQWVHVRHEETGAFAASAEAQLNGIACCAGSSGPGHVHLVNGLYDAHKSEASVLVIASTITSQEFGTDYFQETCPTRLFDDCSGYNQTAFTPVQARRMLHGALQHCIHRPGVSVLGLPGDVAAKPASDFPSTLLARHTEGVYRPHIAELEQLADLIGRSKKTTLFCGVGAKNAHEEVVQLAYLIKAPVAYSFKAKMDIQYDNPFEVGMTGLLGLPAAFNCLNDSELVILLGTDFPYTSFLPDDCRIVQIDNRPEKIGRRIRVDLALGGNVKDTLKALLPMIQEKQEVKFLKNHLKIYSKVKERIARMAAHKGDKERIAPEYVATLVNRYAPDDAVFTVDTGMCCVWGARFLEATEKREMLGSFNHGSMANAMPMAIGAALARPGQQVVALCGDGGISMLLGDLATIVQYKLPIKLIVFNNRSLGMVKLEMEVAGLPDNQTDMYNPDFARVAEAMGIRAISVSDPDKTDEAIRLAFEMEGPVLVSVQTDPESLAMPPKIEYSQMKGFATAMAKLILMGREEEVWDTARSNIKHLWSGLV